MNVYESIAEVATDLAQIGIAKSSKNTMQGFNFRGIDAVYNTLAPLLAKHKLCILPRCLERECVERTNAKGTALFYVTVKAEFDIVAADGTKHTVATYGEAMDSGDKATNKAMSAAYKYAAFQTFCIPTEETAIDADATTHEVQTKVTALATKLATHIGSAFSKGDEWSAFEAWELENDNEVKQAVWSMLDSKIRSTIKTMKEESKQTEKAA